MSGGYPPDIFFFDKVWCDVLISLKDAPSKLYPDRSAKTYGPHHLIFKNMDEQASVMKNLYSFAPQYNGKKSLFLEGCVCLGCTNHVDYLGTLYPIYYRRRLIEKRKSLYTKSNWEKTVVSVIILSAVKFDYYIEYPILFDYDGNVRIPEFYFRERIRGNGERITTYRVSDFN